MEEKIREKKTALLVYCTTEEAEQIRAAARRERRTISGFVINSVMTRLAVGDRLQKQRDEMASEARKRMGEQ